MAEEQKVELGIRSTFDAKGTDDAAKGLKDVESAAGATKGGIDGLTASAEGLKMALGAITSVAAVVAFLTESTEGALDMEKALRGLDLTAERLGQSVEDVRAKARGFADQLAAIAGIEDDKVIAAISKHYQATEDLAQAESRAAIAADLAIKTGIEYEHANNVVSDALRGRTKMLEKLIGVTFEGKDAEEKAASAIEYLEGKVRGSSAAVDDHVIKVARLSAQWKNFKDSIGEQVINVFDVLVDKFHKLNVGVSTIFDGMFALFRAVKTELGGIGDAISLLVQGKFKEAANAFASAEKQARAQYEADLKASLARTEAEEKRYYDKKRASEKDLTTEHLKSNALEKESDDKVFKGRMEQADSQIRAWRAFQAEQKKLHDEMLRDLAEQAKAKDRFDKLWAKSEKNRIDDEVANAVAAMRIKIQLMKQEAQMRLEVANAAVGLLGEIFGQTKEVAAAQAIINTYEGATKALSQGGIYGTILAAIVIAAGLAQVAKIMSTSPNTNAVRGGSAGFDDPGNDAAARIAGRRWALDMVGEWTGGARLGWAEGMASVGGRAGSTTVNNSYDNRRTTNVHMHGSGLLDPSDLSAVKKLKRQLDIVETQIEGQRTIARAAKAVG